MAMVAGFCILTFSIVFIGKSYQPFISNTHTFDTRTHLFSNTLKMISENWLTGVGGGNWQIYFPKYGLEKFQSETAFGYLTYQRPHNDFLWVFSETGIAGFIIYCFIFISILYAIVRKIKNSLTKEDFYEANLLLFAIIGYIFIANFDFPLERIEHQELLIMFFVLAEHKTGDNFSGVKKAGVSKMFLPFLSIFIFFSLVVTVYKIKGEVAVKKSFVYKQKAQWELMIKETTKAENYFYRLDPFSNPVAWYRGVGYFTLDNMDKALECFRQAYAIHPFNIHVLNNLAGTYARKGDYANAIYYYGEALKISPKFSESLVNLSAVYYNKGDYDKAYKLITSIPDTCTQPNYHIFKKAITKSMSNRRLQ
jgi:tetratricopeptide (TPR) repeat protein